MDTPIRNSELKIIAIMIRGKVGSDIDAEASVIVEHAVNERLTFTSHSLESGRACMVWLIERHGNIIGRLLNNAAGNEDMISEFTVVLL